MVGTGPDPLPIRECKVVRPSNIADHPLIVRTGTTLLYHKRVWPIGQLPMHVGRFLVARHPLVRVSSCSVGQYEQEEFSDYMIYTRASQDDWNRLASVTGDNGWSWSSILPYAKKVRLICCDTGREN